jgi:hypothetical protein
MAGPLSVCTKGEERVMILLLRGADVPGRRNPSQTLRHSKETVVHRSEVCIIPWLGMCGTVPRLNYAFTTRYLIKYRDSFALAFVKRKRSQIVRIVTSLQILMRQRNA